MEFQQIDEDSDLLVPISGFYWRIRCRRVASRVIFRRSARSQQQQEVLIWLLEPLGHQWTKLKWKNTYLQVWLNCIICSISIAFSSSVVSCNNKKF
ncbi:hypothetical protein Hdeb2414_s0013g00405191 [Helianthus debilis subsp. tardiflorus]